jgi:tetratricopeptide (TPR) repeat protein
LNNRAEALAEAQKGLEIVRRIALKNASGAIAARDVSTVTMRIAGIYEATGRTAEAIVLRTEIAAQLDTLRGADAKSMESARDAAIAHSGLGNALLKAGRMSDAEPELLRAKAINAERIKLFPQDLQAPLDLAAVSQYLGDLYERTGRSPAAITLWQEALALRADGLNANRQSGPLLWRQAMTHYSLGNAYEKARNISGARASFTEAFNAFSQLRAMGQVRKEDEDKPEQIAKRLKALR